MGRIVFQYISCFLFYVPKEFLSHGMPFFSIRILLKQNFSAHQMPPKLDYSHAYKSNDFQSLLVSELVEKDCYVNSIIT